jgi:hypothetical protein
MATMNFSVPRDVKAAFDRAFTGHNKSGILTQLMLEAIERQARDRRRARAARRLLSFRRQLPRVTTRSVRAARIAGRP